MVVQHNLQAMNSNRMLNITQGSLSKSTEKLSSGYKINRAADDAAGLAISEKMRKQINGLNQASNNAQDGISCVQTAEGALAEVEDMLQRMNQLSVQASNGTNSKDDRQNIQDEIDQLVTEIDRVAETSKFNETYLLKGATDGGKRTVQQYSYKEATYATTGNPRVQNGVKLYKLSTDNTTYVDATENDFKAAVVQDDKGNVKMTTTNLGAQSEVYFKNADGDYIKVNNDNVADVAEAQSKDITTGIGVKFGAGGKYYVKNNDGSKTYITDKNIEDYLEFNNSTTDFKLKDENKKIYTTNAAGKEEEVVTANLGNLANAVSGEPMLYDKDGNRISANALATAMDSEDPLGNLYLSSGDSLKEIGITAGDNGTIKKYVETSQVSYADDLELTFHVGSEGAVSNKISIDIESMDSVNLGVNILKSSANGIVDEDGQSATDAIGVIADAIKKVSAQRSGLGAIQNRLEHTINNLDNIAENTTSAESAIRDTDMATEMVKYSNANILAQAGQSMLAQANQSNQGVLSLLG